MEAKLYVGNLSYHTTEQNLRELFMQAGNVNSVALIKEPGTQRSKGFAFVEMGSPSELQKAIGMFNGYSLDDRLIAVSVARPREERMIVDLAGLGDHSFNLLQVLTADRLGLLRLIAAGMAALVVCGSTVVISFMAYNERRERAAEG